MSSNGPTVLISHTSTAGLASAHPLAVGQPTSRRWNPTSPAVVSSAAMAASQTRGATASSLVQCMWAKREKESVSTANGRGAVDLVRPHPQQTQQKGDEEDHGPAEVWIARVEVVDRPGPDRPHDPP